MRVLEVNPSNWVSKDKVTVKVLNDGTFTVYDYKFRMEMIEIKDPETGEDLGRHANVHHVEKSGERKVFFGFEEKLKNGKVEWTFVSGDISREDEDPYVAAVQIICNIF
jgi:hypothetical protein